MSTFTLDHIRHLYRNVATIASTLSVTGHYYNKENVLTNVQHEFIDRKYDELQNLLVTIHENVITFIVDDVLGHLLRLMNVGGGGSGGDQNQVMLIRDFTERWALLVSQDGEVDMRMFRGRVTNMINRITDSFRHEQEQLEISDLLDKNLANQEQMDGHEKKNKFDADGDLKVVGEKEREVDEQSDQQKRLLALARDVILEELTNTVVNGNMTVIDVIENLIFPATIHIDDIVGIKQRLIENIKQGNKLPSEETHFQSMASVAPNSAWKSLTLPTQSQTEKIAKDAKTAKDAADKKKAAEAAAAEEARLNRLAGGQGAVAVDR